MVLGEGVAGELELAQVNDLVFLDVDGQVGDLLDRVQVLAGHDLGVEIAEAAIEFLDFLDELVALLDVVYLALFQGDQVFAGNRRG